MESFVDIAFDCFPLRSVSRVDIPIDASPEFRERCERLQRSLEAHGGNPNAYFLYNTRCVYRLANSEVENMLRFRFGGTILTDLSDFKAERADLEVELAASTCAPLPEKVMAWFRDVVTQAVLIEFDRFISAGRLAARVDSLGNVGSIADLADFSV